MLELIVVLLVLGVLAAIAVPTYNTLKTNSVDRSVNTTLDAIARAGEAAYISDPAWFGDELLGDERVAEAAMEGIGSQGDFSISRTGAEVTVSLSSGTISREGSVSFADGLASIEYAGASSGGGGPGTTAPPTTTPVTVPGVPSITSINPADEQLSVSFTAPASNGGAAITDYEYTLTEGISWVSAGTSSPFTITGLSNGTTYQVQLRAVNSVGAGTASAASTGTPRTVPGQVTGVTATGGDTIVDLAWTAPATGGSAILGYMIENYDAGLDLWMVVDTTGAEAVSYQVTGLSNGTAYSYRISAMNAASYGPVSATVTATPATTPGVPSITSVTAADTTLEVAFTAPASNGGAAITDYEYTLNSGTSWVSAGTSSPFTITGLSNGTAYQVQLRAVNSAGAGSASAASTGTPFGPLSVSYASTSFSTATTSETQSPTVSGGSGPVTYSYTGTLPDGVSFDTATGVFTGPSSWALQATQVSAGSPFTTGGHTCAVTLVGGVKCWGSNNEGQLGTGTLLASSLPVSVKGPGGVGELSGVTQIATSDRNTCALLNTGAVYCWGAGSFVGDGTVTRRTTPVEVIAGGVSHVSMAASGNLAGVNTTGCAVTVAGGVKCWGKSVYDVAGITSATHVSFGRDTACVTLANGSAKCWGSNSSGQLGSGLTTTVTACTISGLAYTTLSEATCSFFGGTWGLATVPADSSTPVDVAGLGGSVSQVHTSNNNSCALMTSGAVKCWGTGYTVSGVSPYYSETPVTIIAGDVVSLAIDGNRACAVLQAGQLQCWGNSGGSGPTLGDGSTSAANPPISVPGVSDATAISVSYQASCFVSTSNEVRCWGTNTEGSVGDGTTTKRTTPVEVVDIPDGFPAPIDVTATDSTGSTALSLTLTVS